MRWLWLRLRESLRLGLQETWQVEGSRMTTGLMVNAIALVVASFAMHGWRYLDNRRVSHFFF